jgi:peptide deformylase
VAVRPIRTLGDPVLREKAKKVRTIDESIQKLIDDMIETMRDAPGVGLAANQVGVLLRVIVIEVPEDEDDEERSSDRSTWQLYTMINPQIVKRSGERVLDEGCLSIPGYKAPTPRSMSVTAKGLDRNGKEIRIKADNTLLAEALEHEIDHINGVLYVDHLESIDALERLEDEVEHEEEAEPSSARGS